MKRFILAPVLALALAAAACGGPDTGDYVRAVNDAVNNTGSQIADLSASIDETAPRDSDVAVYDEQANQLRALADKINNYKDIPEGFADANHALAQSVNDLAVDVDHAEETSATDFARKIQVDSTRIQSAINAINGKV